MCAYTSKRYESNRHVVYVQRTLPTRAANQYQHAMRLLGRRPRQRAHVELSSTLATTFVLALALAPLWSAYVLAVPVLVLGMLSAGPLCVWVAGTRPFRSDVF